MVGQAKKSHGGLTWPTALWSRLARVFGFVGSYMCGGAKVEIFILLVIPGLTYGCGTWTPNTDLKSLIDTFGTRCPRRITGYCWYDFVSNQRLFSEAEYHHSPSTPTLRLYGHVARYPEVDPAYQVERDNPT